MSNSLSMISQDLGGSDELLSRVSKVNDLAIRYRDDDAFRTRVDAGDIQEFLADFGIDVRVGVEVRVVADDDDTCHFVIPPNPNVELADEQLFAIAGGKGGGGGGKSCMSQGCGCGLCAA